MNGQNVAQHVGVGPGAEQEHVTYKAPVAKSFLKLLSVAMRFVPQMALGLNGLSGECALFPVVEVQSIEREVVLGWIMEVNLVLAMILNRHHVTLIIVQVRLFYVN